MNSNIEPSSIPIACHGKLPIDREYVHRQVGDIAVDELDRWVRDAHRHAFLQPNAPTDGYDHAPAFGFIFEPDSGHRLQGVLAPSRDSTGRRYPFWTAWPAPGSDISPDLFANQQRFVSQLIGGEVSIDSLRRHTASIRSPSRVGAEARSPSDRRAASNSLFGKDFLHDSLPPGSPLTPSQYLAAWVHVFEGKTAEQVLGFNYGLQLPLPTTGSTTRSAALWIDATRRINRSDHFPISAFWSLNRTSNQKESGDNAGAVSTEAADLSPGPFLLLFFGSAPISAYGHLFEPARDRSFLYTPTALDPEQATSILNSLSTDHQQIIDALEREHSILEMLD